jgi:hypothetical protein
MADDKVEREGPVVSIQVTAHCDGCKYHSHEYYCVEDGNDCDSGFYNYCSLLHPTTRKDIGERTPKECPFLTAATAPFKVTDG